MSRRARPLLETYEKTQGGDIAKLKAFTNMMLGEVCALEQERSNAELLK